jgi:hypothetical protein
LCLILPAQGWADLASFVLRTQLSLVVPEDVDGRPACGIVAGGVSVEHKQGEIVVFDDSFTHYAYNNHPSQDRIVLMIDMMRPAWMKRHRRPGPVMTDADLAAFLGYFMS